MMMFTPEFQATTVDDICQTLREHGAFTFEGALTNECVDRIIADVSTFDFRINNNGLSPVKTKGQTFLTNFMAVSKASYDLVTSDLTVDVCDRMMGRYAIAGKRIYETRPGFNMQWHCDVEKPCVDRTMADGIVFIYYLQDVTTGYWQYLRDSFKEGGNFVGGPEVDARINAERGADIVGAPMPRGSCVIYNGRTVHRAKPMGADGAPRKSMFFQINKGILSGEPNVIDIGFADNLDDRRRMLLGVWQPSCRPIFPNTSIHSLDTRDLTRLGAHVQKILE